MFVPPGLERPNLWRLSSCFLGFAATPAGTTSLHIGFLQRFYFFVLLKIGPLVTFSANHCLLCPARDLWENISKYFPSEVATLVFVFHWGTPVWPDLSKTSKRLSRKYEGIWFSHASIDISSRGDRLNSRCILSLSCCGQVVSPGFKKSCWRSEIYQTFVSIFSVGGIKAPCVKHEKKTFVKVKSFIIFFNSLIPPKTWKSKKKTLRELWNCNIRWVDQVDQVVGEKGMSGDRRDIHGSWEHD